MKITAVYCSGRRGSASGKAIDAILAAAKENGAEVSEYHIGDCDLRGCRSCRGCKAEKATACVINDVLKPYWADLFDCDLLIVGAANYMGDVQAQAYTFMNRHFGIRNGANESRLAPGKRVLGIFAQGAPNKEQYVGKYNDYINHFTAWGMVSEPIVVVTEPSMDEAFMQSLAELGKAL